jgi:hypothetical protein
MYRANVRDLPAGHHRLQHATAMHFSFNPPVQAWIAVVLAVTPGVVAVYTLPSNSISPARRRVAYLLIGAGVIMAGLPFINIGGAPTDYPGKTEASPATMELADSGPRISIDAPEDGTIPLCAVLTGRAPGVPDRVLWIAYRKENNSNYFYLQTTRKSADPQAWTTAPSTVGDQSAGARYHFYGFYASLAFNEFLLSMRAGIRPIKEKPKPYTYTLSLPNGMQDAPLLTLRRNSNIKACAT